ncbi:MAG: hypothetical protein JRN46_01585 [Nitrososphaerota archaeon]|nr:hypothetical protein [Nitrososphaerota archaeon]
MVRLCNKCHFDGEGVWHKCGLPVEHIDATMVHVHACGLPSMTLPLDASGACRYRWMDPEELAKVARAPAAKGGEGPTAAGGSPQGDGGPGDATAPPQARPTGGRG